MSRVSATPYIEWAKLAPVCTYNLAASGLPPAAVQDIGGMPAEVPLHGDNAYGYAPLLDRIARHHGVALSQVVTTTGCSMANYLALAALVEPGDEVLVERPTYEPLLLAAAHLGAAIKRFERRAGHHFEIAAADVTAALTDRTRLIVLTNLHNPTSQSIPPDVLRAIGNAADRVGARVLVDEVYLDAVFEATPPSCVHLGPQFVATRSLTKVYGLPALRCGWILGDASLITRAWRINDLIENTRPFLMDLLAAQAFEHLPALLARSRHLLDENRRTLAAWAEGRDDIEIAVPAWGTTVCARPLRTDAATLCATARRDYDLAVVPGHFFELPDQIRIGLCAEPAIVREGLARLGECLARG